MSSSFWTLNNHHVSAGLRESIPEEGHLVKCIVHSYRALFGEPPYCDVRAKVLHAGFPFIIQNIVKMFTQELRHQQLSWNIFSFHHTYVNRNTITASTGGQHSAESLRIWVSWSAIASDPLEQRATMRKENVCHLRKGFLLPQLMKGGPQTSANHFENCCPRVYYVYIYREGTERGQEMLSKANPEILGKGIWNIIECSFNLVIFIVGLILNNYAILFSIMPWP